MISWAPFCRNNSSDQVYRLAADIHYSLSIANNLNSTYRRPPLTDKIEIKNVFEKAKMIARQYGVFSDDPIPESRLAKVEIKAKNTPTSAHVLSVLKLVEGAIKKSNSWHPMPKAPNNKTDEDIFQMLRAISAKFVEIAEAKNFPVTAIMAPAMVFEENFEKIHRIVFNLMRDKTEFKMIEFGECIDGKIPGDVFLKLEKLYEILTRYLSNRTDYSPITIRVPKVIKRITPADVLDLTAIIVGEFKFALDSEMDFPEDYRQKYKDWVQENEIVPGHVYALVSVNLVNARKI